MKLATWNAVLLALLTCSSTHAQLTGEDILADSGIKGGVIVDVMGVDAFLPGSQISLRQVPDFDALIDQMMDLKIIKLNLLERKIGLSIRALTEVGEREVNRARKKY